MKEEKKYTQKEMEEIAKTAFMISERFFFERRAEQLFIMLLLAFVIGTLFGITIR